MKPSNTAKLPIVAFILSVLTLCSAQGQPQTRPTMPNERPQPSSTSRREAILVQRVTELEKEIAALKQENALLRKQLQEGQLHEGDRSSGREATAKPRSSTGDTTTKLRVKGDIPRNVYSAPRGQIIGKVEPGSRLRPLQAIQVNNLVWYQVELEAGQMHTLDTIGEPVRALGIGWVPAIAVERQ